MPRSARQVLEGVPHHVTQRGSRKQTTFFCDEDYRRYRRLLEGWAKDRLDVWAYCLMPNHVHLVVVPHDPEALAHCLGQAHSAYAREINAREGWSGHLWQARFYSVPLGEAHVHAAIRYVLQNPVRARLVPDVASWAHSSVHDLLGPGRDPLVAHDAVAGLRRDWPGFLRGDAAEAELDALRRGTKRGKLAFPRAPAA